MISEWAGTDSFKKNMNKHGSRLIDRVSDRLIKVSHGSDLGQVFSQGLKNGFQKAMGNDDGGGSNDATMTDESAPV